MALAPTREQLALQEALANGEPEDIADFLEGNAKRMQRFMQLPRRDFNRLVDYLKSGNPDMIERALTRFDQSLDLIHAIPTRGIALTPLVRKPVVRAQLKDEFSLLVHNARKFKPVSTLAGLWATTMAFAGLDRNQRNKLASAGIGGLAGSVGGMALSSFLAINTAQAALPPPDEAAAPVRAPLELSVTPSRDFNAENSERLYINPYLYNKMKKDAQARDYFQWSVEAAMENGLNPVQFANQMFRESVHYNPDVIACTKLSPKGAMGLSQIILAKGKEHGMTKADYCDAKKSIFFGAQIMHELMEKYNDDQGLAAAAYNGGNNAIAFAAKEMSLRIKEMSGDLWLSFNEERHETLDNADTAPFAWHNETRAYVADLDGTGWDAKMKNWAHQQQGKGYDVRTFHTHGHMLFTKIGLAPRQAANPAPAPKG